VSVPTALIARGILERDPSAFGPTGALDPPSARGRCHRAPRLDVGHLSKPGTSPSTSGFRVFGSSFATGTPRSPDRSMRCSAPRASGSFERRSAHLGRMHSRSGSFEDRAPRVPRPRPDLRSSAPRASARGVRRALRGGETTSGTALGRARRYPNTAGPGDSPNAGRTKGRARRSDPRVSLGGVIRIVEPFRVAPGPRGQGPGPSAKPACRAAGVRVRWP
jgi:hypothetical protein